jgi:hypothetical protein
MVCSRGSLGIASVTTAGRDTGHEQDNPPGGAAIRSPLILRPAPSTAQPIVHELQGERTTSRPVRPDVWRSY